MTRLYSYYSDCITQNNNTLKRCSDRGKHTSSEGRKEQKNKSSRNLLFECIKLNILLASMNTPSICCYKNNSSPTQAEKKAERDFVAGLIKQIISISLRITIVEDTKASSKCVLNQRARWQHAGHTMTTLSNFQLPMSHFCPCLLISFPPSLSYSNLIFFSFFPSQLVVTANLQSLFSSSFPPKSSFIVYIHFRFSRISLLVGFIYTYIYTKNSFFSQGRLLHSTFEAKKRHHHGLPLCF